LLKIENYEKNLLHGTYFEYYKSGNIKVEGNYWEGEKDSVWIFYDEKGNEIKSRIYKRGMIYIIEETKK